MKERTKKILLTVGLAVLLCFALFIIIVYFFNTRSLIVYRASIRQILFMVVMIILNSTNIFIYSCLIVRIWKPCIKQECHLSCEEYKTQRRKKQLQKKQEQIEKLQQELKELE